MNSSSVRKKPEGYRRDIDGLRAFAVMSVVFSHMQLASIAGGFVGVDVFFVISGYLITDNIAQGLGQGKFTIPGFYERRMRRILPALLVLLVAVTVPVVWLFPPTELVRFGFSLLAALFSYSNLYFATQAGYFGPIQTKVLLHTWSLGVEEQFYLVFPILMTVASRRSMGAIRSTVAIIITVSFLIAVPLTLYDRDLAFYMPYTRAWELMAGSAVALSMAPVPRMRCIREATALAGLLLIVLCIPFYSEKTLFPGLMAVAPVAGAAMIILTGTGGTTWVSALLSTRIMVGIGLISYSVYLWHLPIIMVFRPGSFHGPWAGALRIFCVPAASLILGWLSWRFVEQPFRTGRLRRITQRQVFQAAGWGGGFVSVIALMFIVSHGLPRRFPEEGVEVGKYLYAPQIMRTESCFVEHHFSDYKIQECLTPVGTKPNILLFGDSHAAALWYGLNREFPTWNLMEAASSGCEPTLGAYDRSMCGQLRRYIFEKFVPSAQLDGVILTVRWASIGQLKNLESTIALFRSRGVRVLIVGPVPEYSGPLPLLLALGAKWHSPTFAQRHMKPGYSALDDELAKQTSAMSGVSYVSLMKVMCPTAGACQVYSDANQHIPMLVDDNHLSNDAAVLMIKRVLDEGSWPWPDI